MQRRYVNSVTGDHLFKFLRDRHILGCREGSLEMSSCLCRNSECHGLSSPGCNFSSRRHLSLAVSRRVPSGMKTLSKERTGKAYCVSWPLLRWSSGDSSCCSSLIADAAVVWEDGLLIFRDFGAGHSAEDAAERREDMKCDLRSAIDNFDLRREVR